jgi:uncharacterized radical SAM protein YgiQ
MFLPTTREEMEKLGWDKTDIILVTGDAYLDSSFIGVAIIGKVLLNAGFKVGIIAQPDVGSDKDIKRLGEPELFWGITAGAVDSMVANYTTTRKRKKNDDFTPGGINAKRPDRATIAYSNLVRKYFKNTKPIVLGGIEASLRRIAHYDYWDDSVRRSILFDSKADILVYGMGEKAILELSQKLKNGFDYRDIRGICYISPQPQSGFILLPSYEEVKAEKLKFIEMFHKFYDETDPITASGLCQKQDTRYLIQNPPAENLTTSELDAIYGLDYKRDVHPYYKKQGEVRALETIKFSITAHRGCYGECNFCSLTVHQGRTVFSRSVESIIKEAGIISRLPDFKGYILDVGGPTANMYGIECGKKLKAGICKNRRCLYPAPCKELAINHKQQIELLKRLRGIKGVKKIFIASGLRYDMVMEDRKYGGAYLENLVNNHISGQLKIAPEHTEDGVLKMMGKTGTKYLPGFRDEFERLNKKAGKNQFLTYYLIAAHPGCTYQDMQKLKAFTRKELKMNPEQVQIFTPIPSTYSTLMYYTGLDPFSKKHIFVEKDIRQKERQKEVIVSKYSPKDGYRKT